MKIERSEFIHDALGYLDDEMIKEVDAIRESASLDCNTEKTLKKLEKNNYNKVSRPWRKWTALAASVCVLVIVGSVWQETQQENYSYNENMELNMQESFMEGEDVECEEEKSHSVTLPAFKVDLRKEDGIERDMMGFFIYDGRCYVQTCDYMSEEVIEEYVCTTTGLIDEWTSQEGYVEFAGSIEADVYSVKGVDPEFMLCVRYDDGIVETYSCNNGISLSYGSKILEDWLGFETGSENYEISYLTHKMWDAQFLGNENQIPISGENREIFDKFLISFAENEVLLREDIPTHLKLEDSYHLYITTEEGVPLHFQLLGEGYVSYYGLYNVCVKMDQSIYEYVIEALKEEVQ